MSSDLYCSGLYWAVDVCEVTVMQPEREAESRAQGVRFHHCTICNIAYEFKIQRFSPFVERTANTEILCF